MEILEAFYSGVFTFGLTGLGSLIGVWIKRAEFKIFSFFLGLSGGIMISASFWSLLNPALEKAREIYSFPVIPVIIGFILGVFLLRLIDLIVPHLHLFSSKDEQEGLNLPLKTSLLILLAITIHNIPEGLALGVSLEKVKIALGIGLQNIPEGLALALVLRSSGFSKFLSFFYGFLSAIVEPIFALIGALTTSLSVYLLPYILSLAGGAMIFVTIEELLPSAQRLGNSDRVSLGFGLGFILMMFLDLLPF